MASVEITYRGETYTITGKDAITVDYLMHHIWYAGFEAAERAEMDSRRATAEDHRNLAEACSKVWL